MRAGKSTTKKTIILDNIVSWKSASFLLGGDDGLPFVLFKVEAIFLVVFSALFLYIGSC